MSKNEPVLVLNRNDIPRQWSEIQVSIPCYNELSKNLNQIPYSWLARNLAEDNTDFKQLIPYIIVKHHDKISSYARQGNEKRLVGLKSIGVGGHIEMVDHQNNAQLIDIAYNCAKRELEEEFGLSQTMYKPLSLLGLINEEITAVGKVHFGIVLLCEPYQQPNPQEELVNLEWLNRNCINPTAYELWSTLALELFDKQSSF